MTELDPNDKSGEYKMETIQDSAVYAKEADGHLPRLYYLVTWKGYPKEENTWKPSSSVMQLRKMINTFHKDHPEKPTTISPPLDTAPLIARSTVSLPAKQKQRQLTRCAKKHTKWTNKEEATKRNPSQCASRVRSRQEAGDLSPWRKKCRGACGGSLTIDSSTLKKLHSTLFWPSFLSFKPLIIQVFHRPSSSLNKPLLFPPLSVFPSLSLVQVRRFFH